MGGAGVFLDEGLPIHLLELVQLLIQGHQAELIAMSAAHFGRLSAERLALSVQAAPMFGQFLGLAGVVRLAKERALQRGRQRVDLAVEVQLEHLRLGVEPVGLDQFVLKRGVVRAREILALNHGVVLVHVYPWDCADERR